MKRGLVAAALALAACRREGPPGEPPRLESLRQADRAFHDRVKAAVADDPVVRQVLASKDTDVVMGIRSGLTQRLLQRVTACYLDQMTLDLEDVEAKAKGDLHQKTFLGKLKVGDWRVELVIDEFRTRLRAQKPSLRVLDDDEIDLDIPVEAQAAPGRASIHFAWDSTGIADLVCKDFELTRTLDARIPRQTHTIGATFRVAGGLEGLKVEPVARRDTIRVTIEVPESSWEVVAEALKTQDTFSRCGIGLDPPKVIADLKARVAQGFDVRLPDKMMREVALPARFERTGRLDNRPIAVTLRSTGFRLTRDAIWTGASISVDAPAGTKVPPRPIALSSRRP